MTQQSYHCGYKLQVHVRKKVQNNGKQSSVGPGMTSTFPIPIFIVYM